MLSMASEVFEKQLAYDRDENVKRQVSKFPISTYF